MTQTVKNKTKKYSDLVNQEVKELAEDLNLNENLAKEIEMWFANTDVYNSGGNRRRDNLFKLFRKVAVDHYIGITTEPTSDGEESI